MILLLLSCAPSVDSISENQQAKADFGGATLPAAPGNPRVPVLLQQPATTVIPDPNDAISRGFGPFAGGDFNGDGYADLAIGAVDYSLGGSGEVWVHNGSSGGVSLSASQTLSNSGAASFGYSLLCADFDGDGYDDLAVGGPNENGDTGAVWVYLGSSSGLQAAGSIAGTPSGNAAVGALFGIVLAAGDVDADGDDELFVSATGQNSWGGEIYVYDGGAGGPFTLLYDMPQPSGTYQGWALAVGDLDGDGLEDLAVGSAMEEVNVYLAGSGLPSNYVDWTLYGASGANNFGEALVYLEDSDGDGQGELAVSADAANYGAGEVQIYGGGTNLITTLGGATANLGLGCSLSTLDSNGDGLSDLLAGACATSSLIPYQVQLFEGSAGSLVASTSLVPATSNSGYRYPAGLGDVNGDGFDDAALLAY
ncbi:MAG TPA: FG-GAP repeat protein, partial [Myxococcota bacterium]|nr:FG-GAP repeat protein [Myxococcota bacterium]